LSDVAELRDGIAIGPYEDWMRDQVVDMIVAQYGSQRDAQEQHFVRFYEHPYQRDRGIRLGALDQRKVVGFQSFFHWPYRRGSTQLEVFQSGNSLVDTAYRGRQIFARLLSHLDRLKDLRRIDFLVGFPVQMSYGSFLRNGWANPLNLSWYTKVIHPTSALFRPDLSTVATTLDSRPEAIDAHHPDDVYALAKDADFESWRSAYGHGNRHLYFHHHAFGGRRPLHSEVQPTRKDRRAHPRRRGCLEARPRAGSKRPAGPHEGGPAASLRDDPDRRAESPQP